MRILDRVMMVKMLRPFWDREGGMNPTVCVHDVSRDALGRRLSSSRYNLKAISKYHHLSLSTLPFERNFKVSFLIMVTSTMQSMGSPMYCLAVTSKVAMVNTITDACNEATVIKFNSKCKQWSVKKY